MDLGGAGRKDFKCKALMNECVKVRFFHENLSTQHVARVLVERERGEWDLAGQRVLGSPCNIKKGTALCQ